MLNERRNVMRSVNINRDELLKLVRENKEKHVREYQDSVADYKVAVLKLCTENLKLAKTGDLAKIGSIKAAPNMPTSYEESYTRAIRMLELSVDQTIELQEDVFNQLVLDEWSWKRQFVAASAMYKSM